MRINLLKAMSYRPAADAAALGAAAPDPHSRKATADRISPGVVSISGSPAPKENPPSCPPSLIREGVVLQQKSGHYEKSYCLVEPHVFILDR